MRRKKKLDNFPHPPPVARPAAHYCTPSAAAPSCALRRHKFAPDSPLLI